MHDDVHALLVTALADPDSSWTLGGFGALAEFRRDPHEPIVRLTDGRPGLSTPRGGIAFARNAPIVPVAYETALPGGWSHALALCLPTDSCRVASSRTVTELGPDAGALRLQDAGAVLFDLGLALPQAEIRLRSGAPEQLAILRRACGRAAFAAGSPLPGLLAAGALDLVAETALGRVEVFARIGPAGPGAPRAFVVPQIVALRRTHAATAPIPHGLVPCAHLHPPHPCRDGLGRAIPFRPERHAAFQALHARWGDPDHVALKMRLVTGPAPVCTDRRSRAVARVAQAQALAMAMAMAAGSTRD